MKERKVNSGEAGADADADGGQERERGDEIEMVNRKYKQI
jgi:hypothetical protein